MASETREFMLPIGAVQAYTLVRNAGSEVPSFKLVREDPQGYAMQFSRGFGWTNPMDIQVAVFALAEQQTQVRMSASLLALMDPFGFMRSALDLFERRVQAHHQAMVSGTPLPPVEKDKRAMWVNLILIGGLLAFTLFVFLVIALMVAAN